MCKYEYKTPFAEADYKMCTLYDHFYKNNIVEPSYWLPTDKDGYCLLHSKDGAFKLAEGFQLALNSYMDHCQSNSEYKFVDLRGVVLSGMHDFILKDKTYTKQINLSDAEFVAPFKIETSHLHGDIFLDQCIFHNTSEISDSSFSGSFTAIGGAAFNKNVSFNDVKFEGLFDISDANFMSQVNFIDVTFNAFARFDKAGFNSKDSFYQFIAHFNADTHFNGTRFEGQVQFEDCSFNGEVQFVGTKFNDHTYIPKPTIKGTLLFKGSDEAHRIFNTSLEMAISEDSFVDSGQIIFEHANLIYLDSKTKSQLAALKANRRVSLIGNTETFRFSFDESYPYGELDEIFISQLLHKIKQYFDKKLAKHFEFIMSQVGEHLVVTFYTDDYANVEDFKFAEQNAIDNMYQADTSYSNDAALKYLSIALQDQLRRGIQLRHADLISKEAFNINLSIEKQVLNFFSGSKVEALSANNIFIDNVNEANISTKIIELENDPVFKLEDFQFEQLKNVIVGANLSNEDIIFIKSELDAIKTYTTDKIPSFRKELREFLMQKGINVADGLISRAFFEVMVRLLFGGGV